VPQHTGVTRGVGRCAMGVWGKVEKKQEKEIEKKYIIKVNFTSTVYFSQKAGNNENNNSLMRKVLIVKFQELPSLMFPIQK
jgi:hypothetical protein